MFEYIKKLIVAAGGYISFAEFMQAALYTPEIGYYTDPRSVKFGLNGDFITAPMLGEIFASAVYNKLQELFLATATKEPVNILEIGAGNGLLAYQLLKKFQFGTQLHSYGILEISPQLCNVQQHFLLQKSDLTSEICQKLLWLEDLPSHFNGIILANELLDAFPVNLFTIKNQQILEKVVIYKDNAFAFTEIPASGNLLKHIKQLPLQQQNYFGNKYYSSEVCLIIPGWIQKLASILKQGFILLCDYGFLAAEYYHPSRYLGTLMGHRKHRANSCPLLAPGLQDLTAHVDFTLVMNAAINAGLKVNSFCSLSNFLMEQDLLKLCNFELQHCSTRKAKEQIPYKLLQEINTLTSPCEMGEIFKMLILST